MLLRTFMCGYNAKSWNTKPMSRCDARLNVTSSPSSRTLPDDGSSSPAIMRSVVVLPQPEGPSSTKHSPSAMVNEDARTAVKSPKRFCRFSSRISATTLVREMTGHEEAQRADQDHRERPAVQLEGEGLHLHEDPEADDDRRRVLPGSATEDASCAVAVGLCLLGHLRTAPKVIPRKRCLRSKTVKQTIGMMNNVVPAATAGQSWPPSPMIKGMKGGMVWATPLVNSTANAYSFHAKIRQKTAVAAMPVAACGSTVFTKACRRV